MINWNSIQHPSENRDEYFRLLKAVKSPLSLLPAELLITHSNSPDISEPTNAHYEIAAALKRIGTKESNSRAEFILQQCSGEPCEDFFAANCESWGIPIFKEDILNVRDFKFGFLFSFRDHTSSWSEDYVAREWFYTSPEALFTKQWSLWNCDSGNEELTYSETGDYKQLLYLIASKYSDYEALKSPVFTMYELKAFAQMHAKQNTEYTEDELIENFLIQNPNWVES